MFIIHFFVIFLLSNININEKQILHYFKLKFLININYIIK